MLQSPLTPKSVSVLFVPRNNQNRLRWGERKPCPTVGTQLICVSTQCPALVWPLTSNTDPARLNSTGLSTQPSDPVSKSIGLKSRIAGSNQCYFSNKLFWVASCVGRCVLTLKRPQRSLTVSTSSSWIWPKPSETQSYSEMFFGTKAVLDFFVY